MGALAVVAHGIGVIPLIKQLQAACPGVTQTRYAHNTGSLGTFDYIELYFIPLKHFGTGRGYYLETLKSVLIGHQNNLASGK